ncbi:type II toxin-antitoxin system PemK/MazF family toxin [Lentibacillus jeotgali]|uniref:type II toxin-antitoxin system PemK/MazF family toxin n=1 Tax=Lentibacillus jeotgali TaxID=558169 RepID=UPI0002628075|nr:type II toxin-antitoxin system PemK/MazF family toxin [Lentibacillus jeotgali]
MQIPEQGDLVFTNFNPQVGREQAGYRPGIVLSPKAFNRDTHFAAVCPITSKKKGYPFEVDLPEGLSIEGVILTDQVRTIDWRSRLLSIKDKAPEEVLESCINRVHAYIPFPE